MRNRTLVRLGATESCIYFRTISRIRKSPARFFVTREEMGQLEKRHYVVCNDLINYAKMYYRPDLNTLEIRFSWLSEDGSGTLTGWTETVILDWQKVWDFLMESELGHIETASLLSVDTGFLPVLDFSNAQEPLRRVLSTPGLRHKLTRVLRDSFQWSGTRTIKFYPDWEPCSFSFTEIRPDGSKGISGGLILHQHGQKGAYYGIHT